MTTILPSSGRGRICLGDVHRKTGRQEDHCFFFLPSRLPVQIQSDLSSRAEGMSMHRYGFNFQWMFIWERARQPEQPDERALDFMAKWGMNFVRVPTDYRFWTNGFDYFHPDEAVFLHLDRYLDACRARGLQMSLNLHRAPGYCI